MTTPNSHDSHPVDPTSGSEDRPFTTPESTEHTSPPEPGKDASLEEIEADIERTRDDLGETVERLAGKLDVKSRAKQQISSARMRLSAQMNDIRARAMASYSRIKESVTDDRGKPNSLGWAGLSIAATAVTAAFFLVLRRGWR